MIRAPNYLVYWLAPLLLLIVVPVKAGPASFVFIHFQVHNVAKGRRRKSILLRRPARGSVKRKMLAIFYKKLKLASHDVFVFVFLHGKQSH